MKAPRRPFLNFRTLTLNPSGCEDLLQVLTVLTMERPVSFAAEDIRDEKVCTLTRRDA